MTESARKIDKIYIAAPLFTPYERSLNLRLSQILGSYFETFLPQRDGMLLPGQDLSPSKFVVVSKSVFRTDCGAIDQCRFLLAVLDGRTVDEGVAFELGYAFARGKVCIGFRTDTRVLLPGGLNPMVQGALLTILGSESELSAWASANAT
jgi:nucleoside 2-deoxyribosyltransferase